MSETKRFIDIMKENNDNFYYMKKNKNEHENEHENKNTQKEGSNIYLYYELFEFMKNNNQIPNDSFNDVILNLSKNPNLTPDELLHLSSVYSYKINLSVNPHVNISTILNNLTYDWDWKVLASKESITLDIIEKYKNLPWDITGLPANPNITTEYLDTYFIPIIKNMSEIKKNCMGKCNLKHPTITCKCSKYNLDGIVKNESISIINIINYYLQDNLFSDTPMVMFVISRSDYTLEMLDDDISRNTINFFYWIHTNPNITIDFLKKHRDINMNWCRMVIHPNIKIADIIDNPDLGWGKDAEWWNNPNVVVEDLIKHNKMEQSQWFVVSSSPNTSLDYILNNPQFPWSWKHVSSNPNLTPDIILKPEKYLTHKINWEYSMLVLNKMTFDKTVYKNKINKYIMNCRLIISDLRQIICHYV